MHSLATAAPVPTALAQVDREKIYQWINELSSPETRENALLELSKKRESVPDLAPMLWHSFGTIAALLQEIVNIYPSINPPTLTAHQSNRVCNALALLQCVASHPETRSAFLAAHIPLFLYPFLHTVSKTRPFEYLRLTSLGVIGALVKTDEQEVINFLLTTEIIPLCLRIMESGSELSKTVATFILQKILLDDTGLAYICQTYERFSHVAMILGKMVLQLSKEPSARLLKHVVRCYLRLSDNPRAREALRQCLPDQLKDTTFAQVLKDDTTTKRWLAQLLSTKLGRAATNGVSTFLVQCGRLGKYSSVSLLFSVYITMEYNTHGLVDCILASELHLFQSEWHFMDHLFCSGFCLATESLLQLSCCVSSSPVCQQHEVVRQSSRGTRSRICLRRRHATPRPGDTLKQGPCSNPGIFCLLVIVVPTHGKKNHDFRSLQCPPSAG
ncbi:CCR4-NOT transcription complex subunit 9 [Podarcis lilfordi]|uniref:CCR4-NOT transcription complex subunit 9 n=1 Tax=Podarcis lilfordi TaxID=74358 RepID=A0AA35JMK1_9SAUR|nr:CCR4-NOT transcription complex subunit 9 [Podarcis lilfordi]